jgi:FkbM family methyltransferase
MKQKIKKFIILIFGKSFYNFLHFFYTVQPKLFHPRNIDKKILKKILLNKTKVFYKNKVLFTVRNYGDGTRSRVHNFFGKNFGESETVEWIKRFDKNSNFLDIGANIGIFSLLAAKRNHNVIAIEPESLSFAMLNLNIYDNKLNNTVTAFPLSIDCFNKVSHLNIYKMGWGRSMHSFDTDIIIDNQKNEPEFLQGSIGICLDNLLEQIKFTPDYVKIDVDGNELRVIKGSNDLLKSKNIKSILIEIDPERVLEKKEIIDIFEQNSFKFDKKHSTHSNYIFNKIN